MYYYYYYYYYLSFLSPTRRLQLDKRCRKKMEEQTTEVVTLSVAVLGNGPHIAVLAEQVKDLKDTVNILISQIQMLRSELKK
jgi:hypothetical protein